MKEVKMTQVEIKIYTLKDVAKILGVSKNCVWQRARKIFGILGKKRLFSEEDIIKIKDLYGIDVWGAKLKNNPISNKNKNIYNKQKDGSFKEYLVKKNFPLVMEYIIKKNNKLIFKKEDLIYYCKKFKIDYDNKSMTEILEIINIKLKRGYKIE